MHYLFRVALAFAVGLFTASAHAETTDVSEIHVGDRWAWQHTNSMADERDFTQIEDVVEVSATEIRTRIRIKGKPGNGIATYTREWNPKDVISAQYEPYLKEFAFPLQVGKKWDASADKMLFSNGKHGKFFMKGEVTAYEKVTVAAGTFDAYKITLVLDATTTDVTVHVPDGIGGSDGRATPFLAAAITVAM
jgi:hypothetical protein